MTYSSLSPTIIQRFSVFIITCCALIAFAAPQHAGAVPLDKELAYRVQFSKATDVDLLLKKGANPDHVNNVGLPMVSIAASRTDGDAVPVIRALVSHGADVNRGGQNNQYPIIIAARDNNEKLMKYLVDEAEADYTVRDLNGQLPLEIAEYYGSTEIIDMIGELTRKMLDEQKALTSVERRNEIVETLAYSYCEHQYNYYYYSTNRKKFTTAFIQQEMQDFQKNSRDAITQLYQTWDIPIEIATNMKINIADVVKAELDAMISNRERRRRGVGTDKDRDERCNRIAGAWYDAFLERERMVEDAEFERMNRAY